MPLLLLADNKKKSSIVASFLPPLILSFLPSQVPPNPSISSFCLSCPTASVKQFEERRARCWALCRRRSSVPNPNFSGHSSFRFRAAHFLSFLALLPPSLLPFAYCPPPSRPPTLFPRINWGRRKAKDSSLATFEISTPPPLSQFHPARPTSCTASAAAASLIYGPLLRFTSNNIENELPEREKKERGGLNVSINNVTSNAHHVQS